MLMFASHYAGAQRTVSGFSEVRITEGDSKLIDGQERTEPDIYYVDKGDGTYQAIRLTVAPAGRSAMTVPYIYMNTSHSICVNWKSMTDGAGSVVRYGRDADNLSSSVEAGSTRITARHFCN